MANSTSIILHQYPASLFSEKVHTALRLKNLAYSVVETSMIMPRPDLMPMTGGYRRIPVLQIGADIYCDTALILREIEKRFPEPPLASPGHEGLHAMIGAWSDKQWFPVTIPVVFAHMGDAVATEFIDDREKLSGNRMDIAQLQTIAPMLQDQWRANLSWIEERLSASLAAGTGKWLLGSKPGLGDVHAYMNIWWLNNAAPEICKAMLADVPKTRDWFDALNEIQGQTPELIESATALEIAKNSSPRLLAASVGTEPQGLRPGDKIAISSDDYGKNPIVGELVSAGPNQITLQKVENALPHIHVHFPRAGYLVSKLDA